MKTPLLRIGRFPFNWATLVFVAVLSVRLVDLARLTSSALLLPSHGDMHFYNDWAQRILHGEPDAHLAFYGLPGYAYLLAIIYTVFDYNPFVPGLFQAVLDSGTAVLIYLLTVRILPKGSTSGRDNTPGGSSRQVLAGAAALGWAFFVPAQAYSIILMPTAWFIFVFWLIVWRLSLENWSPGPTECCLLGVLMGITATAVANVLLLVPLVLAALIFNSKLRPNLNWKGWARGAILLLVGIGVGTAPCWVHNYFVARDPVFLSAHSGINFWIGNNPTANGYPRFPPGLRAGQAAMLEDSITRAESAAGRALKRAEVSAYWSAQAKEYISFHFAEWLKLLSLKLRNFWNAFQYDDLSIITNLREQNVILPGLYFGVVAAFAIPGLLLAGWFSPESRWIIAAIFLAMLGLLTIFITERYRLVAVPGLLILASYGLSVLWTFFVRRGLATAATYFLALGGSTLIVSWPQRDPSLWALDAYNSGWQALESNNLDLAERKLAIAYAYVPDNTETLFALGNVRLAEHKSAAAASFYHAVVATDPKHKGAFNNLGVIALGANRYEEAESWLRLAAKVDPRNAKTHFLLAQTLLAEGRRGEAQTEAEMAVLLNGDQPEFKALRDRLKTDSL